MANVVEKRQNKAVTMSAKISQDEYINLCNTMHNELTNIYNNIKKLNEAYTALMKGDNEGPYFNGNAARTFYLKAKYNINGDILAYEKSLTAWKHLRDIYSELDKKDAFPK